MLKSHIQYGNKLAFRVQLAWVALLPKTCRVASNHLMLDKEESFQLAKLKVHDRSEDYLDLKIIWSDEIFLHEDGLTSHILHKPFYLGLLSYQEEPTLLLPLLPLHHHQQLREGSSKLPWWRVLCFLPSYFIMAIIMVEDFELGFKHLAMED